MYYMELTSTPADVGMSKERLDRIHDWAGGYVDSGKLPCAITAVMRHGQLVYVDAQGFRDVESKTPITTDTLFRIFSMTKPITSVAIMMLYEQARFQLDDPVSKYIPEFSNFQVWKSGAGEEMVTEPAASEITIQQIMTHTSGLTYAFMDPDSPLNDLYTDKDLDYNSKGSPLKDWIGDVASTPLAFHPGTQWNYSIATDVLGYLVEVISGQPLDEFFNQHILQPLGMNETSFSVRDEDVERFASAYKYKTGDRLSRMETAKNSQFRGEITRFQGGGGLISSASDYLKFLTMMLNLGELDGTRILGSKTVEFMTRNHMPGDLASMGQPKFGEVSFNGVGFGLGVAVTLDPAKSQVLSSVGEYNWGGAASTAFWNDPVEDISVVFLTQLYPSDTYPLRRELRILVNQAVLD
jgi:CubicO group peptidase (beta-lactamase class C family)